MYCAYDGRRMGPTISLQSSLERHSIKIKKIVQLYWFSLHRVFEKMRVVAGWDHSAYLEEDGSLWVNGHNEYGELGLGDVKQRNSPEKVEGFPPIKSIASGHNNTLLLEEEGFVWSAGMNSHGGLGLGDNVHRNKFEKITNIPQIREISNHYEHSILLDYDGCPWVFGNYSGHSTHQPIKEKPTQMQNLPPIHTAATGASFSLLADVHGSVWAFNAGQLNLQEGKTAPG